MDRITLPLRVEVFFASNYDPWAKLTIPEQIRHEVSRPVAGIVQHFGDVRYRRQHFRPDANRIERAILPFAERDGLVIIQTDNHLTDGGGVLQQTDMPDMQEVERSVDEDSHSGMLSEMMVTRPLTL